MQKKKTHTNKEEKGMKRAWFLLIIKNKIKRVC